MFVNGTPEFLWSPLELDGVKNQNNPKTNRQENQPKFGNISETKKFLYSKELVFQRE